jgi:plastocyanin
MRLLLLGAALVTLGVVAGCGQTAGAAPVLTNRVDLPPSYRFDPMVIEVGAGTTVTWTNSDHFTHSVKVREDNDHVIRPGESVSITFDIPGEYPYVCTFHKQDMTGKVIVSRP